MKTILTSTCRIAEPLMHPERVLPYIRLESPDKVSLSPPFIGDQLDYDIKWKWKSGVPIFIDGRTGCGKTTFIMTKLVCRAIKNKKRIIILANRTALLLSYKQQVVKLLGMENLYTPEGLNQATDFENIYICSYQGLQSFYSRHEGMSFDYIIMDECHYFLTDATFSNCSGAVLDMIPRVFKNSKRIYISATMEEVYSFILRAEYPDINKYNRILNYHLQWPQIGNPPVYYYYMPTNYDNIVIKYFDDEKELFQDLDKQLNKTLVFSDSKKRSNKISEMVSDSDLIDADILNENPKYKEDLIKNECFEKKFLISTSVISNGINIKDNSVKNVVVFPIDPQDILQMCGRRRLSSENDGFVLYLYIPKESEIEQRLHSIEQILEEIDRCRKNPVRLLDLENNVNKSILKAIERIRCIDYENKRYTINYLAEDKFYIQMKYLKTMLFCMKEYGTDFYALKVCELFNKEFTPYMYFKRKEDKIEEFIDFMKSFSFPMEEYEFEKIRPEIDKKRISLFGYSRSDNRGNARAPLGARALNGRFKEFEIPIKIIVDKATMEYSLNIYNDSDDTVETDNDIL